MTSPSRARRESMTLSSRCWQKGQRMRALSPACHPRGVEGEARTEFLDVAPDAGQARGVVDGLEGLVDEARDGRHLALAHAARRHGRRADADPARHEGAARLEGDGVLVD